jgi:hypothetical protein
LQILAGMGIEIVDCRNLKFEMCQNYTFFNHSWQECCFDSSTIKHQKSVFCSRGRFLGFHIFCRLLLLVNGPCGSEMAIVKKQKSLMVKHKILLWSDLL